MDSGEQAPLVRRRRAQRPSRARVLWANYKVELTGLVLAALGLFLLFEQLNLRKSLAAWVRALVTGLLGRFQNLDVAVSTLLAQVSLSDVVGAILLLGSVVAVLLRLRWRLLNASSLASGNCPKCDGALHRVHRKWYDRVICLYVPVRRYRCHSPSCGWKGLRVGRHQTLTRRRSPSAS